MLILYIIVGAILYLTIGGIINEIVQKYEGASEPIIIVSLWPAILFFYIFIGLISLGVYTGQWVVSLFTRI